MKYYTVFRGRNPGVYEDWDDAREQVEGFPGALFKSYRSSEEATTAYRKAMALADEKELANLIFHKSDGDASSVTDKSPATVYNGAESLPPEVDADAWAVDASCMGNPGRMEYRGVELSTGKEVFRVGPFEPATNNIGEFLAIVHAMALMTKNGEFHNIYSDSKTGMSWVRNRMPRTKLEPGPKNRKLFELMARAVAWLRTHKFPAKLMKWETETWGEIPADFGRK